MAIPVRFYPASGMVSVILCQGWQSFGTGADLVWSVCVFTCGFV